MAHLADTAETDVVQPLQTLIPLIRDDIARGREAAERAALPFYRAAGEKLLEAKAQLPHGEFEAWIKRHFKITPRQARHYMQLAEQTAGQNGSALPFSSLSDFVRHASNPNYNRPSAWHEPVRQIVNGVDTETLNRARDEMKRAEEREAQRKLALQLIDIGYKVLARKLHPDKGGSPEAMTRLNAVRDRLRQCV